MLALFVGTYTWYEILRWWLPIITVITLVVKAYLSVKKSIGEWTNKLLDNHLAHIEKASISTEAETKITNKLLGQVSDQHQTLEKKVDSVFVNMNMHQEKQMHMWDTISKTLVILEDRSSRAIRARKK
jgi:hypothetical protein